MAAAATAAPETGVCCNCPKADVEEICGEDPPGKDCDAMLEMEEEAADMLEEVGGGGTGEAAAAAAAALSIDAEDAEEPKEE